MKVVQVVFAGIVVAIEASAASASVCKGQSPVIIEVTVREEPITINKDLSLAELRSMSAYSERPLVHSTLGSYNGSIGHVLGRIDVRAEKPRTDGKVSCPRLRIQTELVAVHRRIAVASDLTDEPCRFQAAFEHYERHAAAASIALRAFATELPRTFGPDINQYVRSRPPRPQAPNRDLRRYVETFLNYAVATFSMFLSDVQANVDSPNEIQNLMGPCDDT